MATPVELLGSTLKVSLQKDVKDPDIYLLTKWVGTLVDMA